MARAANQPGTTPPIDELNGMDPLRAPVFRTLGAPAPASLILAVSFISTRGPAKLLHFNLFLRANPFRSRIRPRSSPPSLEQREGGEFCRIV